eukprot:TRINITY_DN10507_c0_g1_i1.p1 TRINITY_DN10507_c0_g1~~TRINITY_DN10507_c0_g1_i1.p1  ORF type:complete len:438 (-),score=130.59 TRINITY_DN10507_c0_g1_i1:29-1288(-)
MSNQPQVEENQTTTSTSTTPELNESQIQDDQAHSEFMRRLTNYTWMNSLVHGYSAIKESSPAYIKGLVEMGESGTAKLVSISTPLIQKLDDKLHIDERGVAVLDKIETTAENVKVTGQKLVTTYANRPINKLLDAVDKILPPEVPRPENETETETQNEDEEQEEEETEQVEETNEEDRLGENPLPRLKDIGYAAPKRVKKAALTKLQNLTLRSPSEIQAMAYVVDLVQYAAEYIDVEAKTTLFKEKTSNLHKIWEEKQAEVKKAIIPTKEIIEKHTSDIKEKSTQAVVAIVSSVTHAAEVVKLQLEYQRNRVKEVNVQKLQENFAKLIVQTKEAVLNLNEQQLHQYVQQVRSLSANTVHLLVETFNQVYTDGLFVGLSKLQTSLSLWSTSLLISSAEPQQEEPKTSSDESVPSEKREDQ